MINGNKDYDKDKPNYFYIFDSFLLPLYFHFIFQNNM